MAAAIPVIASFMAAGEAIAVAGSLGGALLGSVSGFLTVASAALTGIGALTGRKDLLKLGGFMALGGGIANMAGLGAAEGVAAAAQEAANASWSAGGAAEVAGGAGVQATSPIAGAAAADTAATATGPMSAATEAMYQPSLSELAQKYGQPDAAQGSGYMNPADADQALAQKSLQQRALESRGAPVQATAPLDPLTAGADRVAQGAQGMTSNQLNSYLQSAWDKTGQALGNIGKVVKDNKELAMIGGNVLSSMYGPQAEALDWNKSLMARRTRNLNNPVRLGNGG